MLHDDSCGGDLEGKWSRLERRGLTASRQRCPGIRRASDYIIVECL